MRRIPAAVVLAAGGSVRMGSPKALLRLGDTSLVAAHCAALAVAARRIVVVAGAHVDAIRAAVPRGIEVVHNAAWATTYPVDSVRCAVVEGRIRGAVLVTPVDVPPARPATLAALLAAGGPAVPVDADGRRGHPVLLDAGRVRDLRHDPDVPRLDVWLADASAVRVDDPRVAIDFDDPEAWGRYVASADA